MASLPARVWRKFTSLVPNTTDPKKVGSSKWNDDMNIFLGTVCDALSKLDLSADKLAYFTGGSAASLTDLTAFARLLIAAQDAGAARTLLAALNKAGDTMTGDLAMGTHKVTGLGEPTDPNDAATKAYVDMLVAVLTGALVFKGGWNASSGVFPGGGAAQTGWFYKVDTAGTVDGVSFSVDDDIYATVDDAATGSYAGNWLKIDGKLTKDEIEAALGFTFGALAALDGSASGRSLIHAANYAAMRALLGVGDNFDNIATVLADNYDLNALPAVQGFYSVNTPVNGPLPGGIIWQVNVITTGASSIYQLAYERLSADARMFMRAKASAGTYSAWFEIARIDTDGTLSGNSDKFAPSQKAVKTYVDSRPASVAALPPGYLYGLTISNYESDLANDIIVSPGKARDKTDAANLVSQLFVSKHLDEPWAPGGAAGMRNSAAAIADGTYHLFLVTKTPGDLAPDVYADTQADEATALTHLQAETGGVDYIYARRIGAILREGGAIVPFVQNGDTFLRQTSALDINTSLASGTNAQLVTFSVPTGIQVDAIIRGSVVNNGSAFAALASSPDETNQAPSGTTAHNFHAGSAQNSAGELVIRTDISGRIRLRTNANNTVFTFLTAGWIDRRGKDG